MKIRTANPGCNPDLSRAEAFMESTFPGCIQTEKHYNTLQYKISSSSLARIFQMVLVNKDKLNIEDYSVSQTTLDQVSSKTHSSCSIYSLFLLYYTIVTFWFTPKMVLFLSDFASFTIPFVPCPCRCLWILPSSSQERMTQLCCIQKQQECNVTLKPYQSNPPGSEDASVTSIKQELVFTFAL